MAKGQNAGANGKARRNHLPRAGSLEGVEARANIRAATTPKTTDKFSGGFNRPGSRNVRKVGRG